MDPSRQPERPILIDVRMTRGEAAKLFAVNRAMQEEVPGRDTTVPGTIRSLLMSIVDLARDDAEDGFLDDLRTHLPKPIVKPGPQRIRVCAGYSTPVAFSLEEHEGLCWLVAAVDVHQDLVLRGIIRHGHYVYADTGAIVTLPRGSSPAPSSSAHR
jgi:hypothetical protein